MAEKPKHNLTTSERATLEIVLKFGSGANGSELKALGAYQSALDWLVKYKYLSRKRTSHGPTYHLTKLGQDALKS